jgi:hypothetical protein
VGFECGIRLIVTTRSSREASMTSKAVANTWGKATKGTRGRGGYGRDSRGGKKLCIASFQCTVEQWINYYRLCD